MRNQERQLVRLLTANNNSLDIKAVENGVFVGTLKYPVVSGKGATVLEALLMAAARKKRFVEKNVGFSETKKCVDEYEYDYGRLEPIEKPSIEGMMALLVKRTSIQVYFRSGKMHVIAQQGMQIQGHGATLFKALANAMQKLKAFAKRNDIVYSEFLGDIKMYEQHYGEIV